MKLDLISVNGGNKQIVKEYEDFLNKYLEGVKLDFSNYPDLKNNDKKLLDFFFKVKQLNNDYFINPKTGNKEKYLDFYLSLLKEFKIKDIVKKGGYYFLVILGKEDLRVAYKNIGLIDWLKFKIYGKY